ncbi:uncharacterized protein SPAPADRAFT_53561 [Spathaspora passalidarum NRRL Y-27907]|uniref:EamA domain-containing protein n=1 Tax=Spathaspora passalidarum (strain NRRL Y-27907 / 11-Y1) TaxID=619300 RepID=G3AGB7_SPAPN|nr:uncharacterized protein SPAPADRAFT_53561 [Spathaspora passalidarum NRRL Y-27907]EGW35256.1 hypothetical protein SPAPADRAFT_53561 [Spathaspora passalidarum NRRL Y-27907]
MAITNLLENNAHHSEVHTSKTKILFVVIMFVISLASFVMQTELTSQAYQLGFGEPMILLLVTHGSWWTLWPLQAIFASLWRTFGKTLRKNRRSEVTARSGLQYSRLDEHNIEQQRQTLEIPPTKGNFYEYFKKCIVKQFHNIYHTSILIYEANINGNRSTTNLNQIIESSPHISSSSSVSDCIATFVHSSPIKYVITRAFLITLVLTVAGFTWYGAMSMTYASDVTAIYNCSAFTAYAFSVPLLHEKFSWLKASSVIIAISGVFLVAYSGSDKASNPDEALYPYRFWGNLIILVGAVLYGYYEVTYKKYLCIPPHLSKIITPRRQSTFANFVMGLFGFFTFVIIACMIIFAQVFHIHSFNFRDYGEHTRTIWIYISGSIISNLLFSASFLTLMALTSPVLSSVSSLLTIFLIGIVEWWVFGNKLGFQQLLGDALVIVGFVVLTIASWKEISEGNEEDEVETVSTYSFAISTEDNGNN